MKVRTAERRRRPGRQPGMEVEGLRRMAGVEVRVRLVDGTVWTGRLRTDLLTANSLAVYLTGHAGEGTTLYIDQIAQIVPAPTCAE